MNAGNPPLYAAGFPALPGSSDLARLFAGGIAGLVLWEIWARGLTPLVTGGALEPPQLIISLVKYWTGLTLGIVPATIAHYAVGIAGYPVVYWIVSRNLRAWAPVFDIAVWALFTGAVAMMFLSGTGRITTVYFWLAVTLLSATRYVNPNKTVADAISWGSFTWFNALGIMAPLAGLPFLLLKWGDGLSFMSWAGHAIYGAVAVVIYEAWRKSAAP
ncbi:MAG: hypothetical protein AB7F96_10980 [Beijerinckiaceae bacterium]